MREGGGSCEAQAVAVAEAILINRRSSFFATFAFFAAKHQSRVGSFSVERGNAFYTIYTAIICVGLRSGCFRSGCETGAAFLLIVDLFIFPIYSGVGFLVKYIPQTGDGVTPAPVCICDSTQRKWL